MSYSQHSAIATCTINHVLDVNDLISQMYDYLTNHEDETPSNLLECSSFEEFADEIEPYVEFYNDKLTIKLDTDERNCDAEIFDFITGHYAYLMTSKFMKTVWVTFDSREGLSATTTYCDNNNKDIDIEAMLNAR